MAGGLRREAWSYARLWAAASSMAAALAGEHGLEPGDRVLLCAPNSPQVVAAYFGCFLAGLTLVPLDPSSTPEFVARVAARTGARAILVPPSLPSLPSLPGPNGHMSQGSTGPFHEVAARAIPLSALPLDGAPFQASRRPQPSDLAEVVFTSGTTGEPKGVMLTHANIVANVGGVADVVPRGPHYRLLSLLPLSHMFEQTAGLYLPLLYGSSVYYLPSRRPSVVFEALRRQRIVTMVVVPAVLDLLLGGVEREVRRRGAAARWERLHAAAAHLPQPARRLLFWPVLRELGGAFSFFMCGGARLAVPLAERWERMGIRVIEGYGATECAPVIAANALHSHALGTVGRPVAGVSVRRSAEGELLVKGANVSPGYWADAAATRQRFDAEGWYSTGDLAELRADGRIVLRGRLRDLIVLPNGMNVYPEDVERVLREQPGVADCVVLGMPDAAGDLCVHAAVLCARPAGDPSGAAVDDANAEQVVVGAVRRANARLAPHQQIVGYTRWRGDAFPQTSSLKVKRDDVRAVLGGAPPAAPVYRRLDPAADLVSRLRRILAEAGQVLPDAIQPESDLALDLHLDSLARLELALRLEDELGVAVDETELAQARTCADVRTLVERQQATPVAPPRLSRWALHWTVRPLRRALQAAVVFPVHRYCCRPFEIHGAERLRGLALPALFIANHASHLDSPSVLRALPPPVRRRVAVAAAADYFYRNRWLGGALSLLLNTFPFSREGAVRASLEHCGELADAGWSILLYPEGTRSRSGELEPFKSGIGLLASRLRLPVVPVAIVGAGVVLPKGAARPQPGAVRVTFGAPVAVDEDAPPAAVAAALHQQLAALLREADHSAPRDCDIRCPCGRQRFRTPGARRA
jgi:long-chain acyl-CoA synthetase